MGGRTTAIPAANHPIQGASEHASTVALGGVQSAPSRAIRTQLLQVRDDMTLRRVISGASHRLTTPFRTWSGGQRTSYLTYLRTRPPDRGERREKPLNHLALAIPARPSAVSVAALGPLEDLHILCQSLPPNKHDFKR